MTPVPKWYLPTVVVALLWNLLGCVAYLSDVTMSAERLAAMGAAEQALYAARPAWSVAATAIAVWFGALGSLGLILRHRWAVPVLIASLVGVIVQDIELFIVTGGAADANAGVYVAQGVVLVVSIGLVMLARTARANGWIA